MRLKEKLLLLAVLGISISVIVLAEVQYGVRSVPEIVFIRVLDGGTPVTGASCKADIITETIVVEDKPLEEIGNIFNYISPGELSGLEKRGYYKLETGLSKQDKTFEIKIVCINPGATGVSYTILNETNIPCEVKGDYLVC